jgi:hypothetical protein
LAYPSVLKKIITGLLGVAVLGLLTRANAEPISPFTVGPGNSWDVTWLDTSGGAPVDEIVVTVVSATGSFDLAMSTSIAGWTSTLVNPDETEAFGSQITADKTIKLSFADPAPVGGVVVDISELDKGRLAAYGSFQWGDLPIQGNWVNLPAGIPANIPDGGLTASMLGLGLLGLCYVRRFIR